MEGGMDLNELPQEFDYDFLDESDANPPYCTQTVGGGLTREQQKLLFVCNKEGCGRKAKGENSPAESDDNNYKVGDSEPENYNEENANEDGEKKKRLDGGKKRKREKMHHTDCKTRMVVKLIADRWHVIFFARDHNHDLVVKPSLKKFMRFSKEFEKTAKYDVKLEGLFQYLLVPNNKFVYGYGKHTYLVTAIEEEGSYYYECSKFDRDGIICCHIMKIMTRLGMKTIPDRFRLKRWTQDAVPEDENANANVHVQADFVARGMPLNTGRLCGSLICLRRLRD
ncbi:hypothetical protein C2845_PM09G10360 [Panicum miliaceum]|uniref:FAR1 domain-containing protein n=1 Tax=Panicum miliaceum TaxID=4540 RepID=A0A3L6RZZ2_PANMI|nr:hypothetical protein C2845_PM09G10360 [Panicum miliaceum]